MNRNSGHQNPHILILEDNPLDVEILLAELHKAGIQSSYAVVNTKEKYLQKLDSSIDIILSDYSMPQFDAPSALRLMKEESLSELVKFLLESKGYRVYTATTGVEGVEMFTKYGDRISLVFTDFGLPEMDGFTMLQQIKGIRPEIRMLMASGYLESSQRSEIFQLGVYEIIQKPYEPSMILSKIRELLDQHNNH